MPVRTQRASQELLSELQNTTNHSYDTNASSLYEKKVQCMPVFSVNTLGFTFTFRFWYVALIYSRRNLMQYGWRRSNGQFQVKHKRISFKTKEKVKGFVCQCSVLAELNCSLSFRGNSQHLVFIFNEHALVLLRAYTCPVELLIRTLWSKHSIGADFSFFMLCM